MNKIRFPLFAHIKLEVIAAYKNKRTD